MKHSIIRVVAAATAVATTALALSACTSPSDDDNGKLVAFGPQGDNGSLADNLFTQQVEKKFDIDFDWQTTTYDGSVAGEKRQVSLASGDYPDAYFLVPWVDAFSRSEILKYGQQGVLVPLDDLIDEYAPALKERFEEKPDWKESVTAPDGHIYAITQWSECFHCSYPSKLWMNTTWLDKLGLAQPTTTEELRDVLRAFKENDPNGNGVQDEVALSGSSTQPIINYLMNAFTYAPYTSPSTPPGLVMDGDDVTLAAASDGWREGLKYITSLADEGLLDKAAFTQNAEALKALGDNADAEVLGAAVDLHPYDFVTADSPDGRDKNYDAVAPLAGPDGTQLATWRSPVNPLGMFALTNKSTEEERIKAIKVIDYLVTDEGDRLGAMGPEGEAWVPAEAGDVALDPELEPTFKPLTYDETSNASWRSMGQYWDSLEYRNAQVVPEDVYSPSGYERRLLNATLEYDPFKPDESILFPVEKLWPDLDSAAELADLQTNITNYVTQAQAEFVTGQRDVNDDAAWDAYLSDLDGLGLPRYLEMMKKLYDAI
ncbi:putative aldouronate transport system substrate-binding protein [Microbacterium natoriense]|uniref:Aldouronate transport system substrate-binding protein n=1 Tax=Microbacterium natoriense TaxID=284570 RepID=A0AAW8EUI3_9MICO|nr:extracellular solute-binding protein [Microbacterium natoriense]MDQ0646052.1 putative aldouronate transport system substrate-binding protein [Microbacterium natoriense]